MKASICIVILLAGFAAASFDLPFHFMVGFREEGERMINQQVQAAGPFGTARNVSMTFYYQDTLSYAITGVVLRGNQRFQDVTIRIRNLQFNTYLIDVSVTNTNFVQFWAETYAYARFSPSPNADHELNKLYPHITFV